MSYSATYDSLSTSIERLEQSIERWEARLAKQKECPLTPRRRRRIARYEKHIDLATERIDSLYEQLSNYLPDGSNTPKDSMEVEFWKDPITGVNRGLQVNLTDTGLDDTYIGGSDLKVRVSGSGYATSSGIKSFGTTYGSLISGDWAPVDETSTVAFSLSQSRLTNYPDLTVTLLDQNNDIVLSQMVYQNGEVLI